MVAAPLSGLLTRVLPVAKVLALGTAIVGAGMFLAVGIGPRDGWPAVIPMLVLLGFGAGLTLPHLLALAVGVVPASRAGTASGTANSFFPLGTATGVAVFGAVLTGRIGTTMSGPALDRLGVPAGQAGPLRRLAGAGQFEALGAAAPAAARDQVLGLARSAYTSGLSTILLVAGIAGVLAAVASLVLVREHDKQVSD
jgi:hypothetical protein